MLFYFKDKLVVFSMINVVLKAFGVTGIFVSKFVYFFFFNITTMFSNNIWTANKKIIHFSGGVE